MDTLVTHLRNEIDGKKYLLVLDDVWNEDEIKWSDLKKELWGGARGSRILVTTRTERVAKICGTVDSYPLRGLNEHESWSLFMQMAFEKGQEPGENSSIAAIGRDILQKCSGVPLAIKTIGSLLRFKNSETEWLNFMNDEFSKMLQNETDILPTLKLSYDQLQSHLKHCFAYCSLFPKDYEFERSKLIRLWIAQGFVKSSDRHQCLEDVGNEYFMDLFWRSFFQVVENHEFGSVTRYKMHDLMHDLASLEAGSLIATLNDTKRNFDEKTRHVSIGCNVNASSIITSLCKPSGIRSFLCFSPILSEGVELISFDGVEFFSVGAESVSKDAGSVCEAIVSNFKSLRTLDLHCQYLSFLPNSIGKLKHLRYLDLSANKYLKKLPSSIAKLQNLQTLILSGCFMLKELPSSITKLQNLQTLILSGCFRLEELPEDMQKLVNLRHLDIHKCRVSYMPRGLGELTDLQTLSKFVVHYSNGLKGLHGLNNLRGTLKIESLGLAKDVASECASSNLKEKKHLHALAIQWCLHISGDRNVYDVVDAELLLGDLEPHRNLKELFIDLHECRSLISFPSWLSSLTNLVRLELTRFTKCRYFPPLSQLLSLEYLSLYKFEALEYISDEFSSSSSAPIPFFPSLKEISLGNCPNLKGWWRSRRSSVEVEVNSDGDDSVEITTETSITEHSLLSSFPCLSTLTITDCPMLTSMPMFPDLDRRLTLYSVSPKLLQQIMTMNRAAPQSLAPTTIGSSSSTPLSKLKFIDLYAIRVQETLPDEWLKNLTSLESLTIHDFHGVKSLSPGIHLTSLRHLDIRYCDELELANDEDGMQWQSLKSLSSLKFEGLPKLVTLPLGLQHVATLQKLTFDYCRNLTAIPEWIQNNTSLQEFEISGCSSLTSLPEGMRSLTSLQRLRIDHCPILLQRCEREVGEDWPKIAHIPNLELLD